MYGGSRKAGPKYGGVLGVARGDSCNSPLLSAEHQLSQGGA